MSFDYFQIRPHFLNLENRLNCITRHGKMKTKTVRTFISTNYYDRCCLRSKVRFKCCNTLPNFDKKMSE